MMLKTAMMIMTLGTCGIFLVVHTVSARADVTRGRGGESQDEDYLPSSTPERKETNGMRSVSSSRWTDDESYVVWRMNKSFPGDFIDALPLADETDPGENVSGLAMSEAESIHFDHMNVQVLREEEEATFVLTNSTDGSPPEGNSANMADNQTEVDVVQDTNSSVRSNESLPASELPPLRDSLSVVIPMTLIYALILVSGLVGNISTCVVIARNNYMHTATNYYLFSLAISDLLLLISGLPKEMYLIWRQYPYIFGNTFCIMRGLAAETSANATVLTITAFTVERYVAICHPLRSHKLSQLSRVVKGIVSIWISALILAIPQAFQFGVIDDIDEYGTLRIKGAFCTIKPGTELIPYAFQISIFMFFVIPMTIITALYVLIGLKLRRSRGPNRNNHELTVEPRNTNRHSQSHVIRMLVAVVVAFFTCWAPFHIQRLMAIYSDYIGISNSVALKTLYSVINHVSGILYYVSTCINPILYHIMSNKFREAFKDTMRRLFGKPASRAPRRTFSNISHHRTSRIHHNQPGQGGQHLCHHMALQNQDSYGPAAEEFQETCINCRHTPLMCSCRGNSQHKYVRTYRVEQTGVGKSSSRPTTISHTNPANNKPVMSTLASVDFDSRRAETVRENPQLFGPEQSSAMSPMFEPDSSTGKTNGVATRERRSAEASPSTRKQGPTRDILELEGKAKTFKPAVLQRPRLGKNSGKMKILFLLPKRKKKPNHSVPVFESILDSDSENKLDSSSLLHRDEIEVPSFKSTARLGPAIVGRKDPDESRDRRSVSGHTSSHSSAVGSASNTISNSSLQDMDESEFTGAELVDVLAQLQQSISESQKLI